MFDNKEKLIRSSNTEGRDNIEIPYTNIHIRWIRKSCPTIRYFPRKYKWYKFSALFMSM